MHGSSLIVTLVAGLGIAFALGFLATRLKLPPIVGYLLAGIAVGPHTPGIVADAAMATELAEVGVILLMFGVGLHFSTDDLMAVRWIAIPGAVGQIVLATLIGTGVALLWGWGLGAGLVFGLALSVASTVVLLRALDQRNDLMSANGRIAVGWLIVEDLAMVLALVLLPALAGVLGGEGEAQPESGDLLAELAITLGKIALFVALVATVGSRAVPWVLGQVARTGSRELFTLAVLGVALGIAFGAAELFGVSFALGAFCAGIVLAKSPLSHRAAEEALPLQNAFAVLFFVSVGMLFDPSIVVREPWALVVVLLIIMVGKSLAAFAIVLLLRYPLGTALTVSASLAQIGEFSFILASLGVGLGLLQSEAQDLILAGALLSITLNPVAFAAVKPLNAWVIRHVHWLARRDRGARRRLAALQRGMHETRRRMAEQARRRQSAPDDLTERFPLFAGLNAEDREDLMGLFRPRSAVPGERLFRAGDQPDALYLILTGAVEVAIEDEPIQLGPGDVVGEMALLSGERRSADVTAIDYSQFLTLTKEDFDAFVGAHADLKAKLKAIAAARSSNMPAPHLPPPVSPPQAGA